MHNAVTDGVFRIRRLGFTLLTAETAGSGAPTPLFFLSVALPDVDST